MKARGLLWAALFLGLAACGAKGGFSAAYIAGA